MRRVARFAQAELSSLKAAITSGQADKLASYVHPIAVFLPGVHKVRNLEHQPSTHPPEWFA